MNRSEAIDQLASALCKAQAAMKPAIKDSKNPFFKSNYADLSSVWDACKNELAKNGLGISQHPSVDGNGNVAVETLLLHSSGQWLSSCMAMKPVKADPQGIGSTITYARRYALAAVVGVVTEDDDGNHASGRNHAEADEPESKPRRIERAAQEAVAPVEESPKSKLTRLLGKELGIEITGATQKTWKPELERILGRKVTLPLTDEDAKSAVFAIETVNAMEQNGVPIVK